MFHDVRGFQILPGVDVFLPVREAQPHLGDVIGRSALRSLSVIGREVTGGPEDEESGSVIGIVAFLGRNRRHDVAPLEYFGRAELQLPEVNPYLSAVLHGPPLDVERLGNGVDGIPAGISVEGDEFRHFGELFRYGSYFPVFAAQKRIHVVGDQIAEGCEVGRVVKRRFGILSLQPFAFAALHVIILVLSTDLGAALIFFVVYLAMLYIATKNVMYTGAGLLAGGAAGVLAYKLFSHVRKRFVVWRDPWSNIDGSGYQVCQSLFSRGMGSWFGYGFCQGMPDRIPVAEKDFMFSAITEEFGLIFSIALLLVCLNNLILMMNIASRCKTLFYRLVAVGLGVTYGFQVFLTVGGAIKLIPMTGVTLPFVSYGGSSIISSLVMFSLINGMYNMRHDEGEYEDDRKAKNDRSQTGAKKQEEK